jgi:hypothetical protein
VAFGFDLLKLPDWAKTFFETAETVRELLQLQAKTNAALAKQDVEIAALRIEIERLKAREEVIIAKAEAAAMAGGMIGSNDLARRVGHLEARLESERRLGGSTT